VVSSVGMKLTNSTLTANRGDHPSTTIAGGGKSTIEHAGNYITCADANWMVSAPHTPGNPMNMASKVPKAAAYPSRNRGGRRAMKHCVGLDVSMKGSPAAWMTSNAKTLEFRRSRGECWIPVPLPPPNGQPDALMEACLAACDLREEFMAGAVGIAPHFRRRVDRQEGIVGPTIGWPIRKTLRIRIARLDEIRPIRRGEIRDPLVVGGHEPGQCIQVVEDIRDFTGMKRTGVLARLIFEPPFRSEWRPLEAKTEDCRAARFPLRLKPCPGRVDDGQVAAQRPRWGLVVFLAPAGIVAKSFFHAVGEKPADQFRIRPAGVGTLEQGEIEPLVLVPTCEERHVVLGAFRKDRGRRSREKMAVDNGPEAEAASMSSADSDRSSASEAAPALRMNSMPARSASSSDAGARLGVGNKAPLSPMARWNSPLASGDAMSALTASEPADSPAMVTWSGSPPNARMFRLTHPNAATRSSMP